MNPIIQLKLHWAIIGLLIGIGVAFVTNILVLGNTWQEAIVISIGPGIGLAIVFYALPPLQ
ncbi:hypothetical protein BDK88_3640 [Natrinema hispanicum]|uniref:Uncharacterized protein n=1 Tax=Natrinema hispanicum TaxID=392421 RepID=A0A482Y2E8_9EURY|nr:hypothetical protein BDK88_3640 [Natrinema hispanicum]